MMMIVIAILILTILFFIPTNKFKTCLNSYFQSNPKEESVSVSVSPPRKQIMTSTKKDEDELKRVFSTFDKNGDGVITKQELKEALSGIGMAMKEEEVEEMVGKLDVNGDGLIDSEEFESMVRVKDDNDDVDVEMKEAFDVFDGDRDGLITVQELRMVLGSLGLKEANKLEDCEDMIRKVDLDGDGMVDFNEFKRMMIMKSATGLFC